MSYAFSDLETVEQFCIPEYPVSAQNTRVSQATFEGASFFLNRNFRGQHLLIRTTAVAAAGNVHFAIYQAAGGLSTATATLVVDFPNTLAVAGANISLAAASAFSLSAGVFYIVFGLASGTSATVQTYTAGAISLLNSTVQAGTHPLAFTWAQAANAGAPATVNTTTSFVASANAVIPVCRLLT